MQPDGYHFQPDRSPVFCIDEWCGECGLRLRMRDGRLVATQVYAGGWKAYRWPGGSVAVYLSACPAPMAWRLKGLVFCGTCGRTILPFQYPDCTDCTAYWIRENANLRALV